MELLAVKLACAILIIAKCSCETFVSFGSYEYYFELHDRIRSKAQAEEKCRNKNGKLAIVNKQEIQYFLVNQIVPVIRNRKSGPYSFFIGLKRISKDRFGFEWNDGSSLVDGYSDWYVAEPNNGATSPEALSENCVIMGWRYSVDELLQWRDVVCDNILGSYICQRTLETTTEIIPTTSVSSDQATNSSMAISETSTSGTNASSSDLFSTLSEFTDIETTKTTISAVQSAINDYSATAASHTYNSSAAMTTNDILMQPSTLSDITAQITNTKDEFGTETKLTRTGGTIRQSTSRFSTYFSSIAPVAATSVVSQQSTLTTKTSHSISIFTTQHNSITDQSTAGTEQSTIVFSTQSNTVAKNTATLDVSQESISTTKNISPPSTAPLSTRAANFSPVVSSSIGFTSVILQPQQTNLSLAVIIVTLSLVAAIAIFALTFITKYLCKMFKKPASFEYDVEHHRHLHNANTMILMEQETIGSDPNNKKNSAKEIYELEEKAKEKKLDPNKNMEKETSNSTPIYATVNKVSRKQTSNV